jgi:hypothetical protein
VSLAVLIDDPKAMVRRRARRQVELRAVGIEIGDRTRVIERVDDRDRPAPASVQGRAD